MSTLAHTVTINIPFPDTRLATIAQQVLSVDKELKAAECQKEMNVEGTSLVVTIRGVSVRVVRTAVSSFLDFAGLVVNTMEAFGEDEPR
ncbi:uncharacterized protein SPPG_08731 [Spizellomyces punctatus DAOM BR117]|uniref:Transcription factor Pcc1 n=1 Tax=Spizellomyces punctatus (strain DAOM BR117) TaxID=645134 RepID=A0A0L0H3T5_SPIPD|nr:uncharacterized protein SPPG_08731 [Spizellomyces punctatus DAOM BR117]KNC95867.1 hypothetical protein SPPG_08731 [Spizellomyces punctatus DAOM BR117]|eukprot:XP_016603907.1 hypothetical protein SPPG_08731 [Spizellomyces punctatus DAOM BR117]